MPKTAEVRRANDAWVPAKVENISATGMLLAIADTLRLGSQIEVRFLLGEEFKTEFRCRGLVVRQVDDGEQRGVGTRFLSYGMGPPGQVVCDQYPVFEFNRKKQDN